MASQEDVRRIALSLPETIEEEDRFAFAVINRAKHKGFVWVWMERVHPKKGRAPNPAVVAIRVRDTQEKDMYLALDPEKYFTEPHYNGFPAVLVRLAAIDVDELKELITNAWRCQAPPELARTLPGSPQPGTHFHQGKPQQI